MRHCTCAANPSATVTAPSVPANPVGSAFPDRSRSSGTRADARRNTAKILHAAVKVLGADTAASLSDVAREATVTRATVYAHFASRDDLVATLVDQAMAQLLDRTALVADTVRDPTDAVVALLDLAWHWTGEFGAVVRIAHAEYGPERTSSMLDPIRTAGRGVFERAQGCGVVRADLPLGWVPIAVDGLLHSTRVAALSGTSLAEAECAFHTMARRLLAGPAWRVEN